MSDVNGTNIRNITCQGVSARYNAKQPFITNNIHFSVDAGEMMAIMGPSGSGKSTLLNAVLGKLEIEKGKGNIFINGCDVTSEGLACIRDRVGFVPQQDILVDELTVMENVRYFHTIAVDSDLSRADVTRRVRGLIKAMGMSPEVADKKPTELSGGQKKRANMIMELANDPEVLIVDEPTSGLSSADALSIMSYLKELSREQGKIVIVIIHQPSSAIFSLFNKLLLLRALGEGGRGECVASGSIQAIYQHNAQFLSAHELYCKACKTYFPDALLDKVSEGWITGPVGDSPPKASELKRTSVLRSPHESLIDFMALTFRQIRIRMRDRLSMLLTFLVPPLLGVLVALVFKSAPPEQSYAFEDNNLFGQFVFMMIVSGLFLGMVSSVGEVIRDRPMLYRESLRGLLMTAYYVSKLLVLIMFGGIQAVLFCVASFYTLEAWDYMAPNLLVMFASIVLSISIGLFISMYARTAIGAYNLIPLVLIPQIVLGGALLPYSNMGEEIYLWEDKERQMPPLAQVLPSGWLYEGAMTLTQEYTEAHDLAENVKVSELSMRQRGEFLAPKKDAAIADWIAEPLGVADRADETYLHSALVLSGFFIVFTGLGVIDIRRDYRRESMNRHTTRTVMLSTLFVVGVLAFDDTVADKEEETREAPHTISETRLSGVEAESFCDAEGKVLADAERVAELFNEKTLAGSDYWTGNEYRGQSSTLWVLRLREKSRPIDPVRVLQRDTIATAYPVTDYNAFAVCVPGG